MRERERERERKEETTLVKAEFPRKAEFQRFIELRNGYIFGVG